MTTQEMIAILSQVPPDTHLSAINEKGEETGPAPLIYTTKGGTDTFLMLCFGETELGVGDRILYIEPKARINVQVKMG